LKHPWRKSNLSCHGVVESYSKFPPSYKERSQALFEKYYPLEVSIDLSFEEKFKMCEEWWGQVCSSLLVNAPQSSCRVAACDPPPPPLPHRRTHFLLIPTLALSLCTLHFHSRGEKIAADGPHYCIFESPQAHELLLEYKVNKGDIEHMVNEAELTLRDGVDAFFKLLEQHHVPCLVFSAGIADVIEEVCYLVY
jgi:hypothetical protein